MFDSFEKQLEKTLKISTQCAKEREELKNKFFRKYDKTSVITLLDILMDGHPAEQQFSIEFREHYESNNFNEVEIKEFYRLFKENKEKVINSLESNGD